MVKVREVYSSLSSSAEDSVEVPKVLYGQVCDTRAWRSGLELLADFESESVVDL